MKIESLRDNLLNPSALKKLPESLHIVAYLWTQTYIAELLQKIQDLPQKLQESAFAENWSKQRIINILPVIENLPQKYKDDENLKDENFVNIASDVIRALDSEPQ